MIENVGAELKKYFEGKSIFSPLVGLGTYIFYAAAALLFLNCIVSLGGLVGAIIWVAFILGLLLTLAHQDFNALMIGCGVYALSELISLLRWAFAEFGFLSWSSLLYVLIFGYFAYAAFMKTQKKSA